MACLISFDGSEFHHYGRVGQEDKDFEVIAKSDEFKKLSITMPYLRLESSPVGYANKDSIYNFSEKVLGQKQIFKIDSAEHEDFSCLPMIVRASGNCKNNGFYKSIEKRTSAFLGSYLKD